MGNHRFKTAVNFCKKRCKSMLTNPYETYVEWLYKNEQMDVFDLQLPPCSRTIIKTEWVNRGTIVFLSGSFQEIEDDLILKKQDKNHCRSCARKHLIVRLEKIGTGQESYQKKIFYH